jgi:hypothetical protein
MIRRNCILILMVFASLEYSQGQNAMVKAVPILFHGVVMDAGTQSRLGSYEILINRSRSLTGSGDGTFSFYAYKNDTIVFLVPGYKSTSFIISDTLSGKEFLTGVYLETDPLNLGEVIILPKAANLKAELMNPKINTDPRLENAVANINNASYVGRTSPAKLGDPVTNYDYIRQRNKQDAFEKGGIPSDRILGLNPLIFIPAAYLLLHGAPQSPPTPKPQITSKDMDDLKKMYLESLKTRKK